MLEPATRAATRRSFLATVGSGALAILSACSAPAAPSPTPAPKPAATSAPAPAPAAATAPAAAPTTAPAAPPTAAAKPAPTVAPTVVRRPVRPASVSTIAGNSFTAYFTMGKEKGLFEREGIDLKIIESESADITSKALLTGEATVGHFGVPAVFLGVQAGAQMKIIGTARGKIDLTFYAKPGITGPQDLKGKDFGVGAPGGLIYQVAVAYFREKGIDPASVQLTNLGSGANIFKGLVAGKVDAAITNAIYQPTAKKENLNVLASMGDVFPNYPFTLLHARNQEIEQQAPLLIDFLCGWAQSVRYGLDHPEEVTAYMVQKLAKSEEEAKFEVEFNRTGGIISPDLTITRDMVRFPQEIEVSGGSMKAVLPFESVATDALQKEMLARLGPYQKGR